MAGVGSEPSASIWPRTRGSGPPRSVAPAKRWPLWSMSSVLLDSESCQRATACRSTTEITSVPDGRRRARADWIQGSAATASPIRVGSIMSRRRPASTLASMAMSRGVSATAPCTATRSSRACRSRKISESSGAATTPNAKAEANKTGTNTPRTRARLPELSARQRWRSRRCRSCRRLRAR